jgi:hypothetical protein
VDALHDRLAALPARDPLPARAMIARHATDIADAQRMVNAANA